MRSITAVTLRLDQFAEASSESGALLLKRHERKCGSVRNVEKPVFVCVVPHADPKLCPIVHIAAAVGQHTDPTYEHFAEGFTRKPGQDYVSFATMAQRRYVAVLQCAAVAIGVPAMFAEKKLHAFRVQCTNVLGSKEASEAEREAHIGWQSTVQSRHYASLKHTAMNARTPHLLAGRSGRDDPPHPSGSVRRKLQVTGFRSAFDASLQPLSTWPDPPTRSSRSSSPSASRRATPSARTRRPTCSSV